MEDVRDYLIEHISDIVAYRLDSNHCSCCMYERIEILVETNEVIQGYEYNAFQKHKNCEYNRCGCPLVWYNVKPELLNITSKHAEFMIAVDEDKYRIVLFDMYEKELQNQENDLIQNYNNRDENNDYFAEKNMSYYFDQPFQ